MGGTKSEVGRKKQISLGKSQRQARLFLLCGVWFCFSGRKTLLVTVLASGKVSGIGLKKTGTCAAWPGFLFVVR